MMEKLIKKLNNRKGFTLIELIVVIAIIGILAAILIPQFTGFQDRATRTQVTTDAKQISTALDGLIAEGKITANVASATLASDPVVALSGVPAARITSLAYETDGGFTLTSTVTNKAGTAFVATTSSSGVAFVVTP